MGLQLKSRLSANYKKKDCGYNDTARTHVGPHIASSFVTAGQMAGFNPAMDPAAHQNSYSRAVARMMDGRLGERP